VSARRGSSPVAQTTLAEESGMANKSARVAKGFEVPVRESSRCEHVVRQPSYDAGVAHAIERRCERYLFDRFARLFPREQLLVINSERFE